MNNRAVLMNVGLPAIVFVLIMIVVPYLILGYVPMEDTMGWVQRVFYFHVPIAWLSYLAFGIVFVCSILYLWKRERKWDVISRSAAEIGVIFTTLVLISGSIWAKSAWGYWWDWNERLTSELVLWLVYIAYLIVRSFAAEEDRGAVTAAVIGIAGFFSVPISAISIFLWRSVHPVIEGGIFGEEGLTSAMRFALIISLISFTVLFVYLLLLRISTRKLDNEIKRMRYNLRR